MALGRKSELVFESEAPSSSCCIKWKIRHFSCFSATRDTSLKSCQFSTGSDEVWQLELSTTSTGLCCSVHLLSAKASTTKVHGAVSILLDGKKYLTGSRRHETVPNQKYALWWTEKEKIMGLWWPCRSTEDDVMTLNIDIEVLSDDCDQVFNSSSKLEPQLNFANFVTKLWTDHSLTDVTFRVKDKEFKSHKIVLAAASPVLEAMFQEGAKEHRDNYVIEDIESEVFEVFLRYFYTGQVDKLGGMVSDLLALAERYDVQPLKEICVQHMAENISVDNAIDVLTTAVRYSVVQAKSSAMDFIRQNLLDVALTTILGLLSFKIIHNTLKSCGVPS
jgi:BTB/POZ domain